ncbi:MAG: sensor histidine kinase [Burkholderiales bacterium]
MPRLPFTYQLALAPAVVVMLLTGLIAFTLLQLAHIRHENEVVRQWIRITDRLQTAIEAGHRLQDAAGRPAAALPSYYREQAAVLSENLLYPEVIYKSPSELQTLIQHSVTAIRASQNTAAAQAALRALMPSLEALYNAFWEQKRLAYANYYTKLNSVIAGMAETSLYTLLACALLAAALSAATLRSLRQRLGALAGHARAVCAGKLVPIDPPPAVRDELDALTASLATMTQRLIHVVAAENLLHGAEKERKRIAMDLHDQILADLTVLSRNLEAAEDQGTPQDRYARLRADLSQLATGIRRVIDDLHPQTLDILGLEAAIRSFLERQAGDSRQWNIQIDSEAERALSGFQRVNLFRILCEAITNVRRHSGASACEIALRSQHDQWVLTVDDNGTGVLDATPDGGKGHGLLNTRERALSMGGTFTFGPSPQGRGARLELRLPLASQR